MKTTTDERVQVIDGKTINSLTMVVDCLSGVYESNGRKFKTIPKSVYLVNQQFDFAAKTFIEETKIHLRYDRKPDTV